MYLYIYIRTHSVCVYTYIYIYVYIIEATPAAQANTVCIYVSSEIPRGRGVGGIGGLVGEENG